jgi:hypothetical protein
MKGGEALIAGFIIGQLFVISSYLAAIKRRMK